MKKQKHDRLHFHPLILSLLLTIAGSAIAWGQEDTGGEETTYTLQYKKDNAPQADIPEKVDTVFIPAGGSIDLCIEDLRIRDGAEALKYNNGTFTGATDGWGKAYQWYVRWYSAGSDYKTKNSESKWNNVSVLATGDINEGRSTLPGIHEPSLKKINADNEDSWFWYAGFMDVTIEQTDSEGKAHFRSTATGACTIKYTMPQDANEDYEDVVICDISMNNDSTMDRSTNEFTEPTLSIRYKYVIKSAEVCAKRIEDGYKEIYDVTAPKGATEVTISMKSLPNRYCWYGVNKEIKVGNQFVYTKKEGNVTSNNQTFNMMKRVKELGALNDKDITVEISAKSSDNKQSPVLATYIIRPQDNSNFKLWEEIKDDIARTPLHHPELYEQIGYYDFDEEVIDRSELKKENNWSSTPLDYRHTQYAFLSSDTKITAELANRRSGYTPIHNQYALYYSANVSGVSMFDKANGYYWYFVQTNVFDRTYDNTDGKKCGYFYYIDATNEPGTIMDVPVNGTICAGTELLVTTWIYHMSNQTNVRYPNINILLKGKNKNNETVVLHRFTSGVTQKKYGWQQVAYRVVLDQDEIGQYSNFSVAVENNCPSTNGADYAVDDIRIFRVLPHAEARQANSLCEDTKDISIRIDYTELLQTLGLQKNGDVPEMYRPGQSDYKEWYEKRLKDVDGFDTQSMEKYRVVKYALFGLKTGWKDTIKTQLDEITKEKYPDVDTEHLVLGDSDENYRLNLPLIRAIREVSKGTHNLGKCFYAKAQYYYGKGEGEEAQDFGYAALATQTNLMHDGKSTDDVLMDYDKETDKVIFRNITLANELPTDVDFCIIYIPSAGHENNTESDHTGTFFPHDDCGIYTPFRLKKADDLVEIKDGETTVTQSAIKNNGTYTLTGKFTIQKDEDSDPEVVQDGTTFDWFFGTQEEFTQTEVCKIELPGIGAISIQDALRRYHNNQMKDEILAKLRLALGETRVFVGDNTNITYETDKVELVLDAKQITVKVQSNNFPLVVTPNPDTEHLQEGSIYCGDPKILAMGGKTELVPGDPELPAYPDDHLLGVRLGMGQIEKMVGSNGNAGKPLQIPFYKAIPAAISTPKYTVKELPTEAKVFVIETDDPNWMANREDEQKVVATITDLNVTPEGEEGKLGWDDNFQLAFNEQAKTFREGYSYTLRVPFGELVTPSDPTDPAEKATGKTELLYTGRFYIVLKIVPEYVTWQGTSDGSRNWNNDDESHWKRSTAEELYDEDGTRAEQYNPASSRSGTHYDNAFTPMRFTNVIIQNGATGNPYSAYPYLYKLDVKSETLPILNMATTETAIGGATKDIEYDLAVDPDYTKVLFDETNKNTSEDVFTCVRFYGNTCNEIYFKPQTEMMHTEYLAYEKAHIDYELTANRWYTLSSPLKGVVAGDMYLPKGEIANTNASYGVQKTPAFGKITYDATNYTRWNPAVYMRGWDKTGEDKVVVPGEDATGVQYALAGSWSNLYNKVDEPFTPGTGFSIGVEAKDALTDDKVMFRLPKADTKYQYYENEDKNGGKEQTLSDAVRNGNGKLYITDWTSDSETLQGATDDKLKLVGNPFMAHLDMAKFLGEGGGVYYILTEEGTQTNVLGNGFTVSTDAGDATKVAPLQSFLVNKGEIKFTTEMQTVANATDGSPGLRSATVSEPKGKLPEIRITASRDGRKSTAVVAYLPYASAGYNEAEDAALLVRKEEKAPQVYTASDKQMLAINLTDALHNVPVGVYGTDAAPVTLAFALTGSWNGVVLYDKQEKKSYNVGDGLTITVPGNTSGRYVLKGTVPTANEVVATNRIVCYSTGGGRIEVSSVDPLQEVKVYNLSGRLVRSLVKPDAPVALIDRLQPGVYIVRAVSASQSFSEKVEVR